MSRHPSKAVQDARDRGARDSQSSHGGRCRCVSCTGRARESFGRDRAR